jgi:hypothetical protein
MADFDQKQESSENSTTGSQFIKNNLSEKKYHKHPL